MTTLTHTAGAFLALKLVDRVNPNIGLSKPNIILIGIVAAILVDIDVFFSKYIKDHHNGPLHAPLFWGIVFLVTYGMSFLINAPEIRIYVTSLLIGVFSHIFLDWFGGKVAGIMIFWPFSQRKYSLFPLHPEMGKIHFVKMYNIDFLKSYMARNKFLLFSEIFIPISASIYWILERIKFIK